MENASELKDQYHQLHEYLSTITWMHYEEAKKRGRDHKGYLYFFGRTLHRLLHPLYFYHQKADPDFQYEMENFDPTNPEEKFVSWPEKKAFLTSKYREKRLEIYCRDFTRNLVGQYDYRVFQWLIKNNLHKLLEFDSHLGFYMDILNWNEEHFSAFQEKQEVAAEEVFQSKRFPVSLAVSPSLA